MLKEAGIEESEENLNTASIFKGMICVVTGDFPESKEQIKFTIESNGGKVVENVTKTTKVLSGNSFQIHF